jgi:Zn-dependent protease/predicted transcriptional regulator
MRSELKITRISGVDLAVHYSWLLIAVLITVSLASHFHEVNRHWSMAEVWVVAVLTGVLFFASIVLHELSHALVARKRGLPTRRITLFALGGMAQIEREPQDATSEFWMAIVGPLTSVIIGVALLALAYALGWQWQVWPATPAQAILVWLGYINVTLAAFNMIPGFPLDGGRVLRAIVWWIVKDTVRATRIAGGIGRLVAAAFMVYGVLLFLTRGRFDGLWLGIIGLFLWQAATRSIADVNLTSALGGLRARDLMSADCVVVDGSVSLQDFISMYVARSGRSCFVVEEGGRETGFVTLTDVRSVERDRWAQTPVRALVHRFDGSHIVAPEIAARDAMELMAREDLAQLPVLSDGRFVGMITRETLFAVLHNRRAAGLTERTA